MVDVQCEDGLPDTRYHYTSFDVLKSMWENGEVWTTNSRYLNDITETELGPKAIIETLSNRSDNLYGQITLWTDAVIRKMAEKTGTDPPPLSDKPGDQELREKALVAAEIDGACKHALEDTTCFVFSLSQEPDQLSQWRAYAKDGVCIGFSTQELCDGLQQAPADSAKMQSVEYFEGGKVTEAYCNPIIEFSENRRAQLIGEGLDDSKLRKVVMGKEMMLRIAFLKDKAFAEENEVRIAAQGHPNHFTTNRYGIVPRIKLPLKPHAIKSVIVGPGAHADLRMQSLRTYFANRGFKDDIGALGAAIELSKSSVPYRDW